MGQHAQASADAVSFAALHAWKILKDAHNVGQRPPASADDLQHGVGSRRFALDLNGQNAK